MNSVYLRLKEAETLKKALRDVLGLGELTAVYKLWTSYPVQWLEIYLCKIAAIEYKM